MVSFRFCYDEAMEDNAYYRVSVKGLAIDESGRFLLLREADGSWDLPGGGLHHGEDPIAGLRREVQEETGLVITSISKSPKYFVTAPKSNGKFKANVIYEIALQDLNFTPSEECEELRYVTPGEARQLNISANVKKFLDVYEPRKS